MEPSGWVVIRSHYVSETSIIDRLSAHYAHIAKTVEFLTIAMYLIYIGKNGAVGED
jgi:hypothetical protein